MRISAEDFFLYLTIALIILIPLSVRLHRYLTRNRTAKMLREQFGHTSGSDKPHDQTS